MSDETWQERAEALLEFTRGDPKSQSRRVAALYSSFFEEDPLLHGAFGPLALIESGRADCLNMGVGFFDEPIWALSQGYFELALPALLRFRSGGEPEGPLAQAFETLGEARAIRKEDTPEALRLGKEGRRMLLVALEEAVSPPIFAPVPSLIRRSFAPYLSVSIPADDESGGPWEVPFPEVDPGDISVRLEWLTHSFLPMWQRGLEEQGGMVVARLRQIQTGGWFSRAQLPPR